MHPHDVELFESQTQVVLFQKLRNALLLFTVVIGAITLFTFTFFARS